MSRPPFDLGLSEADLRAMQKARRRPFAFDRDAALRLIADASPLVDAAVRRRPLLHGAPFTLPGHRDVPGSSARPSRPPSERSDLELPSKE